jgi:DNA-binding NarL/FixJ family response regulator
MIVLCAWCEEEGQPALMREAEPHNVRLQSHGICDAHEKVLLKQIRLRRRDENVLVVDDFEPCRDALRHICDESAFVNVVAEAEDGESAIEVAFRLAPQIILMDVSMPRLGGAEATRRIKQGLPDVHIIGVSSQDDTATRDFMKAAGCSAFVAKEHAHTLPTIIARLTGREHEAATAA